IGVEISGDVHGGPWGGTTRRGWWGRILTAVRVVGKRSGTRGGCAADDAALHVPGGGFGPTGVGGAAVIRRESRAVTGCVADDAALFGPTGVGRRRRGVIRRGGSRSAPAAQVLPAVDDLAEQLGGFLGVVGGAVGFAVAEGDPGGGAGPGQYRLAEGEAGEGGGVEAGEGVEGVALDAGPLAGGVDDAEVEVGVVGDDHRAGAVVFPHAFPHLVEDMVEG